MSTPKVSDIAKATAEVLDLRKIAMSSERRPKLWVRARQIAMYLAVEHYGRSLNQAGLPLKRDHTTVLCGVRRIAAELRTDPDLPIVVDAIVARIEGGPELIGAERHIAYWRARHISPRDGLPGGEPRPPRASPPRDMQASDYGLDEASLRKLRKAGWSFIGLARRFKSEPHIIAGILGEQWNEMPAW